MAGEIRNKFVSWTLNVVKEIKETQIPSPKKKLYGVGVNLALVQPAVSSSSKSTPTNRVVVDSIEPSGPAAKAGLKPGDVVVEVDERRFDDGGTYLPDDVAGAIRGLEGSEVSVIVERDGKRVGFQLTREPIGRVVDSLPSKERGQEKKKSRNKKKRSKQEEKNKRWGSSSSSSNSNSDTCGDGDSQNKKEGVKQKQVSSNTDSREEPKVNEEEPKVVTPAPKIAAIRSSEEPDKNEKETKVDTPEPNTTATPSPNRLGNIESLTLSEEVKQEKKDLASSVEDVDQFDTDAEHHQPRHCCALLDMPYPCAVSTHSRDSIDEISEEKTADYNEEIASIVNSAGDDSQWEIISERSSFVVSFSGSMSGASFRSASPSVLKNKFVLTESAGVGTHIEHVVLPTDTLQGLCLAYKISATRLRMENSFSGNSLQMAPKKLKIPMPAVKGAKGKSTIRTQDRTSAEFKLYAFLAEMPSMELVEAKAYLDLSNWDLDEALRSAREDDGWRPNGSFELSGGGGIASLPVLNAVRKPKALTAQDVFAAPPLYDGDGFELKDITKSVR